MAIRWDGSLAMGLPEIDLEHKTFVELLGALESAVLERRGAEFISEAYRGLKDYITYHFAHEKRCFDEFGCYPDAAKHLAAHAEFERYVQETKYRFLDDADAAAAELVRGMYDWLAKHIGSMDREYHECFAAHGMASPQIPETPTNGAPTR